MILLGAVFLYGCRVQKEEVAPRKQIDKAKLLLKAKNYYTQKSPKNKNGKDYEFTWNEAIWQTYKNFDVIEIPIKMDSNSLLTYVSYQDKDGNLKKRVGHRRLLLRLDEDELFTPFMMDIFTDSIDIHSEKTLYNNHLSQKQTNFEGEISFYALSSDTALGTEYYKMGIKEQVGVFNSTITYTKSRTCIFVPRRKTIYVPVKRNLWYMPDGRVGVNPPSYQTQVITTMVMECVGDAGPGDMCFLCSGGGSGIPVGGGQQNNINRIKITDDFKNSPCHNTAFQKLKSNPQFKGLIANFENNVRLGNAGFQLRNNLTYSLGVKTKISREASYEPAIENSVFFDAGIQLRNDNDNSQQAQVGLETNEKKPVLIMADILYYTFVVNIMKCTWQGIALSNVNQGNYNVVKASDLRNFFNTYANNPFNNVQKDIYAKLRDNTANTSTILYQKNAGTNLWSVDYQPFYDKVLSTPYFINMMAGILQQADGTMQGQNGLEYYKAIIWDKLRNTPAYNNLSATQKDDIKKKMKDIKDVSPMVTPFVQTCD